MKRVYFLVTASLLAACGGGSSGGGVTPSHAVSNVQQIPVQRTVAAQSLQTEQSTQSVNTFAGIGGTTILAKSIRGTAKRVTSAWHAGTAAHRAQPRAQVVAYGPCTNGTESAQVTVSPTETQIYERVFYDRSCAQIYQDVFLDIVASSASSASATGTVTQYNQSGTAVEYNTLQLSVAFSLDTAQISIEISEAVNSTSPQLAVAGVACGLQGLSPSAACGMGAVAHSQSLSKDAGATMAMAVTATSSGSGSTISLNGSANAYTGSLNALSLSEATFPAWNVGGGTQVDSATVSGQYSYSTQGVPSSGNLTLTDAADDATVSIVLASSGATGTVKQTSTGATVASFVTDLNGNGTITYSNGSTGQIVDWIVIG